MGEYLITVPLPEGLEVRRNIKKLYEDDFVSRLLIYKSKHDIDAASTSSLDRVQPGKFGSYAECKACYTEIKLSDKPSFDPNEWELHSAECLAREEEDSKFFVWNDFTRLAQSGNSAIWQRRILDSANNEFETQLQHVEMLSSFFFSKTISTLLRKINTYKNLFVRLLRNINVFCCHVPIQSKEAISIIQVKYWTDETPSKNLSRVAEYVEVTCRKVECAVKCRLFFSIIERLMMAFFERRI